MDGNWRNDNIFEDLYNTNKEKKREIAGSLRQSLKNGLLILH